MILLGAYPTLHLHSGRRSVPASRALASPLSSPPPPSLLPGQTWTFSPFSCEASIAFPLTHRQSPISASQPLRNPLPFSHPPSSHSPTFSNNPTLLFPILPHNPLLPLSQTIPRSVALQPAFSLAALHITNTHVSHCTDSVGRSFGLA